MDLLPIRGLIDAGDIEQARRLLTDILRQNPKNSEARALLERCDTSSFLPPPPPPPRVPSIPVPMQQPAIPMQVEKLLKDTVAVFIAHQWKQVSYAPTVAIVEREQHPRFIPALLILLFTGFIGGIFVLFHLMNLGDLEVMLIPQPDGSIRIKKGDQISVIRAPHEVSAMAEIPRGMGLTTALLFTVVGTITSLLLWALIFRILTL